jgi:hypothetical protein
VGLEYAAVESLILGVSLFEKTSSLILISLTFFGGGFTFWASIFYRKGPSKLGMEVTQFGEGCFHYLRLRMPSSVMGSSHSWLEGKISSYYLDWGCRQELHPVSKVSSGSRGLTIYSPGWGLTLGVGTGSLKSCSVGWTFLSLDGGYRSVLTS